MISRQTAASLGSWLAFAGWLGLLTYISSRAVPQGLSLPIPHFDKILHFGFFALGAMLLATALLTTFPCVKWPARIFAWLALGAMGLFDEIRQLFTPGRSGGDPFDLLADILGVTVGLALIFLLHARIRRTPSPAIHPAPRERTQQS
ncbi:MAG: hypothetical protein Fur0032_08540 [Terrimicrobiaceae bacterium]